MSSKSKAMSFPFSQHEVLSDLKSSLSSGDMLETLKQANVLKDATRFAKVILSGELNKAVSVRGLKVTKGARAAIEAAGGKVEE